MQQFLSDPNLICSAVTQKAALEFAMLRGNELYDACAGEEILSVDEVLTCVDGVDLYLARVLFFAPDQMDRAVRLLKESSDNQPAAGVCVLTPISISLACISPNLRIVDSHSQSESGALLSIIPEEDFASYFHYFWRAHKSHYLALRFVEGTQKRAHFSVLRKRSM